MRIAVGGHQVSCNSFATQAMDLANLQRGTISGEGVLAMGPGHSALYGFLAGAKARGWQVAPLHFVYPAMYGKITREAHEWAKEQSLSALRAVG